MSKKPGKKVLRLGMIQNGRIVEERLMRSPTTVTIGHAYSKNVLVVPASNLPRTFKLFEPKGSGYLLHFNSKMSGRISMGDGVRTLEELVRSNEAKKSGDGYLIELSPKARGKIKFGEVTILFQFVTPPPPRPKPVLPASMRGGWIRGIDARLAGIIIVSALLQAGFVGWVQTQDFPEQLDGQHDIPDRFVKVEPDDEELDLDDEEEKESDEEDGDEAAEDEEAEAEPQEAQEEPEEEEKSAEERAEEESEERQRMAQEVEDKTILKEIGAKTEDGGTMRDALAEGVGDTSVEDAFSGSDRVERGKPGAEKDGLDTSGSADADGTGSAAGIDDPEKSEGAKAAENEAVDTGEQEEETVQAQVDVDQETTTAGTGQLDSSRISRVVQQGASAIQRCFERELKNNPEAGGKLVITVTIGGRGRVEDVTADTGIGGGFKSCASQAVQGWRFPPPKGGDVTFNKTFVLQSSN